MISVSDAPSVYGGNSKPVLRKPISISLLRSKLSTAQPDPDQFFYPVISFFKLLSTFCRSKDRYVDFYQPISI